MHRGSREGVRTICAALFGVFGIQKDSNKRDAAPALACYRFYAIPANFPGFGRPCLICYGLTAPGFLSGGEFGAVLSRRAAPGLSALSVHASAFPLSPAGYSFRGGLFRFSRYGCIITVNVMIV